MEMASGWGSLGNNGGAQGLFSSSCLHHCKESAARATVPGGSSIACSTAKVIEWDASWSKNLDPSGRAALGVHVAAYEEDKAANAGLDSVDFLS